MGLTQALYDALAGDSQLVAELGVYRGVPAIFTGDRVPEDAKAPLLWSPGAMADTADDTKDLRGRNVVRDIHVVAGEEDAPDTADRVGRIVQKLLHRATLMVEGQAAWMVDASGPVLAPTDKDSNLVSRIVTIRVRY